MNPVYRFNIVPCSKPRMTRQDKWKKRPSVVKFFAFRDAIKQSEHYDVALCMQSFDIEFYIEMPKSWSKKKRALYNGQPHLQRPDLDNFVKAWCDSVFVEDSVVWRFKASKLWTDFTGHINLSPL